MKGTIIKIITLILLFFAIVTGYIFLNREKVEKKEIIMGEPTLPTVTLYGMAGNDSNTIIEVNELFGYKAQMDSKYMRDTITPISGDRKVTVHVRNYGNYIMGAEFELRTLDCKRLIEDTTVEKAAIVQDGEYTDIDIQFQDMIEKDTEYVLVLRLNTDLAGEVNYYTRVVSLTENHCSEEMAFINTFSDATFTKESDKISTYIEPDASMDNTNFAHVNIKSSYTMITWDSLQPEKITTPVVAIKELLGNIGCYELTYKIRAYNDYKQYDYYIVKEYFRVKWSQATMYLLDYDRTTTQIFDANNSNISPSRINLGIADSTDCRYKSSESNRFVAFSKKNSIWLMDIKNNTVTSLFAFQSPEDDDKRDNNTNSEIFIVSVDDSGNTEFVVSGYMNRGEHEGMVGVSLYSYDAEKNVVNEKVFIPFARQYEVLKQMMGNVFYVNDKNTMYLMLSDNLYSMDLTGSEYVSIVSNATKNHFAANGNGNEVAWEEQSSDHTKISILNLETGEKKEISAGTGEKIGVVGFIDDDFVYGVADENDVIYGSDTTYAMNRIIIVDEEGKEVKNYTKDGYYFTNTTIKDNMISVSRYTKNADRSGFTEVDNYQIFGNEENDTNALTLKTIATDTKKIEYVINFIKKVTTSKVLKNEYPQDIIFGNTNALNIHELITENNNYYVYGKGKMNEITTNLSHAIIRANELSGVVIDENGQYVWARRDKPENYEISGLNIDLQNITSNIRADISGVTLNEVLYYISNDRPVMAMTSGTDSVIIVGYDFYNVILLNPSDNTRSKMGQEEASQLFKNAGNKFMLIK